MHSIRTDSGLYLLHSASKLKRGVIKQIGWVFSFPQYFCCFLFFFCRESWWGFPPPFLTSKMEEWLMMTFVLENCLLNLFVVLDLDLGSILIDNSFFFVSQKLEINIIYFICLWQQYEKCHSVYVCRFLWNYPILRHVQNVR